MSDNPIPAAPAPPVNDPAAIREILGMHTIAVVGLSDSPARTSYGVARYLQQQGYAIIPVNPTIREALGQRAYPSLPAIGRPVDVVNVFRRSEYVAAVVDEAIAIGARAIWMQVGVADPVAAERARAAGLRVVMNRCLMVEHAGASRQ
ncbi:MAG TPA: CoA-binding protein [Chloroflexia bacterium]|nr:CoA-binding protein [Chloroflexia bacterium]